MSDCQKLIATLLTFVGVGFGSLWSVYQDELEKNDNTAIVIKQLVEYIEKDK